MPFIGLAMNQKLDVVVAWQGAKDQHKRNHVVLGRTDALTIDLQKYLVSYGNICQ